jgi:hypothetical protein
MKMQVDYDSFAHSYELEAQKLLQQRNKMILNHRQAIMETKSIAANDFAGLTTLYRKIFRYLIEFSPNIKVLHDKNMDREIAAALESVFPRIGLKAFVELADEEKSWQLQELGRIILGIRLYNRQNNRGGVGIEPMDQDSIQLVNTMHDDINNEMTFFTDACQKYQYAIVKATYHQKRYEKVTKALASLQQTSDLDETGETLGSPDLPSPRQRQQKIRQQELLMNKLPIPLPQGVIDRWLQELTNRRQYLSYLKVLFDEISNLKNRIQSVNDSLDLELRNLNALISNRTSVPKEVVYPRFDAVGGLWIKLYEDVTSLISWSKTYKVLCKYRLSFHPTLSEKYCLREEIDEVDIQEMEASNIADMVSEALEQQQQSILLGEIPSVATASTIASTIENPALVNPPATIDCQPISATVAAPSTAFDTIDAPGNNLNDSTSKPSTAEQVAEGVDPAISLMMSEIMPDQTIELNLSPMKPSTMILNELHADQPSVMRIASTASQPHVLSTAAGSKVVDPGIDDDLIDKITIPDAASAHSIGYPMASATTTGAMNNPSREIEPNIVNVSGATLLSIETTPDFLLLPLELQGYCPWTIIHARGLLIPGQPKLGVVRYNSQYFVFDHAIGIKAFVNDPEFYLQKIKERAIRSPEFIHLLRLQKWFPKTSIARLLENPDNNDTTLLSNSKPNMKDVGTSTPTHFLESYIDLNYYWNEWEMRRNALKIINLKNCLTTSSQTDSSHFRRENTTQVYLPKENDTQTRRDKGINPPKVTSYVAGLRGKVNATKNMPISKFMKVLPEEKDIPLEINSKTSKLNKSTNQESRPHVVLFTTDL